MKELFLKREPSSDLETMGKLTFGDHELFTIEQEWRPTAPGGEPNNSCVPAGTYALIPHTRGSGKKVVALVNPGLGVYYKAEDRPMGVGRFKILIHAGNYSTDIIGCIAPGIGQGAGPMVTQSRAAMIHIMNYIGANEAELIIT